MCNSATCGHNECYENKQKYNKKCIYQLLNFKFEKILQKNKKNYLNKLINQLKKTVTLFSSQAVQKKKTFHKKKKNPNKYIEDDEEVYIQVIYRLIAEVTKEMNEYSRTVISNKDLKKTI